MLDKDEDVAVNPGPSYEPGDGVVRFVGWCDEGDSGVSSFCAIIDFPMGPPDLAANVVWERLPVRVVLKDQSSK